MKNEGKKRHHTIANIDLELNDLSLGCELFLNLGINVIVN